MNKLLSRLRSTVVVFIAAFLVSASDKFALEYRPVLMTRDNMEAAIQWRECRDIEKPGKIWVYNDHIYVIEQYKGIHVIDNADRRNPQNMGFIQLDGCTDVAVKDGLIYANNAIDLICIQPDIDHSNVRVLNRTRNVLPELAPPDGSLISKFKRHRPEGSIIVRYELR